jgi:hypothetical protein
MKYQQLADTSHRALYLAIKMIYIGFYQAKTFKIVYAATKSSAASFIGYIQRFGI